MVLFLSSEHYGIAHEDESEEGYARSDDDASCREDVGVEGVEPGRASGHKQETDHDHCARNGHEPEIAFLERHAVLGLAYQFVLWR